MNSPENLKKSVDNILSKLRGTKKLDLFEVCAFASLKFTILTAPSPPLSIFQPARVDRSVTIDSVIETLSGFVKEGKFDYIGLSEVSAATLRKASAVSTL